VLQQDSGLVPATGSHRDASIDVDGVRKTYKTRDGDVEAIRGATFRVESGELVAVVGPSGCGKSTLLKMVAGLIPYEEGTIRVAGAPARAGNPDVGIMLQSPVLFPWRTVLENVLLPTEVFGMDRATAVRRAKEMLELVGLSDFEAKHAWELSGGMQQRVSLCRLLVFEPSILLMDEPFGSLDEFTRERLNSEIAMLQEELHRTVLYVTHNITEAIFLADRVVAMSARPGRVLGTVDSRLPRPRSLEMMRTETMVQLVGKVRDMLQIDHVAPEPKRGEEQ
jgi:NitT/TauT family transport system ATP-binding protein